LELKFEQLEQMREVIYPFNRTILELK